MFTGEQRRPLLSVNITEHVVKFVSLCVRISCQLSMAICTNDVLEILCLYEKSVVTVGNGAQPVRVMDPNFKTRDTVQR